MMLRKPSGSSVTQHPRICVFCSASCDLDPRFFAAAREFSQELGRLQGTLVYGGGKVGLMGAFADASLSAGAQVLGVLPHHLSSSEVTHTGLTELVMVDNLFERKKVMLERSDAFVIFPGGFGTLDEALEVITWKVLGRIKQPIVFANLHGFWQPQLDFFAALTKQGMISEGAHSVYSVADSLADVWRLLKA